MNAIPCLKSAHSPSHSILVLGKVMTQALRSMKYYPHAGLLHRTAGIIINQPTEKRKQR
ncbi:hypothetical protein L873DRAFT_1812756 [Choiromyces venosus 120613-1]|uniref:Uncharacterized protein n=1 Tax=Choiromyces venosus 120613-1 TaxID=1336337 RepID=A0A3N4JAZ7_9PEZI|nr:hypothetical protein L873DRAFT_1812756 [Choiromyces venosus 120613-1]